MTWEVRYIAPNIIADHTPARDAKKRYQDHDRDCSIGDSSPALGETDDAGCTTVANPPPARGCRTGRAARRSWGRPVTRLAASPSERQGP